MSSNISDHRRQDCALLCICWRVWEVLIVDFAAFVLFDHSVEILFVLLDLWIGYHSECIDHFNLSVVDTNYSEKYLQWTFIFGLSSIPSIWTLREVILPKAERLPNAVILPIIHRMTFMDYSHIFETPISLYTPIFHQNNSFIIWRIWYGPYGYD